MPLFLILAPFGAFAALMLAGLAKLGLFVAAAICVSTILYAVMRSRPIKMLALGSAFIFIALGGVLTAMPSALNDSAVRLTVNAALLVFALASIALGKPFTLQYAREMAGAETVTGPGFLAANYVITWAWVLAFLLMLLANVLLLYVPGLPLWSGLAIIFVARNIAIWFSRWYPERQRAKFARPPPAAASAT